MNIKIKTLHSNQMHVNEYDNEIKEEYGNEIIRQDPGAEQGSGAGRRCGYMTTSASCPPPLSAASLKYD